MDSTRFWTRSSLPARTIAQDQYGYSDRRARAAQLPGQANGPKQCGKCGMLFMFQHICRASTTQCFKCKAFGHIARNCRTQICHSNRRQANDPTRKSERKKERDYSRLSQFRARKSACVMMPFYEVSNCDLPSCLPKYVNQPVMRATSANVFSVKTALEHATSEVGSLKAETELLRKQKTHLVDELSHVDKTVTERQIETKYLVAELDSLNVEYWDILDDHGHCDDILRPTTVECLTSKCQLIDQTLQEKSMQLLDLPQSAPGQRQTQDGAVKGQIINLIHKMSLTLRMVLIQIQDRQTQSRRDQDSGAPSQWKGKNRGHNYDGEQLPQWNNRRRRPYRR